MSPKINLKSIKTMLILIGFLLVNIMPVWAQQSEFILMDRQHRFDNGKWWNVVNGELGDEIIPNRLIVRLKERGPVKGIVRQFARVDSIIIGNRILNGFYSLSITQNKNMFGLAKALEATSQFDVIEFDAYGQRSGTPSDPIYPDQWNLPKISMPGAWDYGQGQNVRLAIIDSGTDYVHEDLDGNMWVNPQEDINGNGSADFYSSSSGGDLDGLDNDGNGKYDDLLGWDFAGGGNSPSFPYTPDNQPMDTDGHGTAVTGIAAAQTHNYESGAYRGVAGIAGGWGSSKGTQIMALRDGGETPFYSLTAESITYAARNGAKVINISSGWSNDYPVLSQAINEAVTVYDVVVVASSGNNIGSVLYPAAYSNTIAVGATDQNDVRFWWSNYGGSLDIMAPSSVPTTDMTGSVGYSTGNYTDSFTGTSASAPHVAGVAAIMRSENGSKTWSNIRDVIRQTADKVSGMNGNNFTDYYGYGRVNAYEAVKAVQPPDPDPPPATPTGLTITNAGQVGQNPNLNWNANTEPDLNHYNVWRKCLYEMYPIDCSLQVIATTTSTSYIDYEVQIALNDGTTDRFTYYVSAVDDAGNESNKSDPVSTWGTSFFKVRDNLVDIISPKIPKAFALESNYPNPFNPSTLIRYSLPVPSSVTLVIYDLRGNEVTRWVMDNETAGYKRKTWNATDKHGNKVPAGVYLLKMTAESKVTNRVFSQTLKMVLIK